MSDRAGTSGNGPWKRALADRGVGTKIMLAVLVVAVFSVADGLFALDSLGTTDQQVKTGFEMNRQLNDIGNLRATVNRTWLAMDDYLLAPNAPGRATASAAITTSRGQTTGYAAGPARNRPLPSRSASTALRPRPLHPRRRAHRLAETTAPGRPPAMNAHARQHALA